ncbi:MAG: MurR/RpiR family transcriptional regulator [Neisseriaceae bacterium]|nr:MurR/RpiR family transcriptional regulator [Neisseriaceae bacterium]MBP6861171.1 MurR/RpiR family transcriptional regulator [Neisseriaceae bacterium]
MEPIPTNLIKQITEAMPTYSRAFKQLAEFILSKTFAASTMSIDELAKAADVSVATVNRFAHECGYHGYPLFRTELRAVFEKVFEPAEKLRSGVLKNVEEDEVMLASLDGLALNITQTRHWLAQQSIKNVVERLLAAEHVFILGMGVSALHATFMTEILEPFLGTKVHVLNSLGGPERAIRKISMLGPNDVVIAISLPRYSKSIFEMIHVAKTQQAYVIGITDAPTSPLASQTDVCLFASAEQPVLYASSAALIALIEGLCSAVALKVNHPAERMAQQTQSVLPYLYLPTDKK